MISPPLRSGERVAAVCYSTTNTCTRDSVSLGYFCRQTFPVRPSPPSLELPRKRNCVALALNVLRWRGCGTHHLPEKKRENSPSGRSYCRRWQGRRVALAIDREMATGDVRTSSRWCDQEQIPGGIGYDRGDLSCTLSSSSFGSLCCNDSSQEKRLKLCGVCSLFPRPVF